MFPHDLSQHLNRYYAEKGVELLAGDVVTTLRKEGGGFILQTQRGRTVRADGVVAGIGIEPNVLLAQRTGLQVENGIVVNQSLRTSDPSIFAAGDVANFYNPALGQRIRVEHEDNANTMGFQAGQSMAGCDVSYDHLPFFYSDLFDLGYEAVGQLDPRLDTLADWKEPFREGVVYYLREGRVRGVLLWNTWEQVNAARQLIASQSVLHPEDLKHWLAV